MIDIQAAIKMPVHVDSTGRVFIDGEELPYVVSENGIKAEQIMKGKHHLLTLTLIVGGVTMEARKPKGDA